LLLRYPRYHNYRERRLMFFAFIYPLFLYGIECYMQCNVTLRQKLEYLFRKCGRIILGYSLAKYDKAVYFRLDVLPLRLLFQLRCAQFMYAVLRTKSLSLFDGYFRFQRSVGRHSHDLCLPNISSERSRRSVRYWGAKLWNSIPVTIRNASSTSEFTSSYKSYLKSKVTDCVDSYDIYDFI
jgi:hypothetical protein